MRPLSSDQLLRVWETGRNRPPLDRILAVLAASFPEAVEELPTLRLGRLNELLCRQRELTFGRMLDGYVECPRCGERLEFSLDQSAWEGGEEPFPPGGPLDVRESGYELSLRPLEVRDLRDAAGADDLEVARRLLAERCVTSAMRDGAAVSAALLPEPVVAAVSEALTRADPRAELLLDLECPECGLSWDSPLDMGDFLWTEIGVQARRLLREVHALARAYGWSESAILGLSEARRAEYLAMVGA